VKILNVHERTLSAAPAAVGALLDGLAGPDDRLWPRQHWPAMRLDRLLSVGAEGGHGPIAYRTVEYEAGTRVRFRFTAPAGLEGEHGLEVTPLPDGGATLRHVLEGRSRGTMVLAWTLVYRPLHDALLEDALYNAAVALGESPLARPPWSPQVRLLRRLLRGRQPAAAIVPTSQPRSSAR